MDAYDSLLVGYQKAAVNTEAIASVLNAGQGTILAVGLTGALALAAAIAQPGTFTAGDLVMAPPPPSPSEKHQSKRHLTDVIFLIVTRNTTETLISCNKQTCEGHIVPHAPPLPYLHLDMVVTVSSS